MKDNEQFWNWINMYAVILQIMDLYLLIGDTSNNALLKEIQNQNTAYLEKIQEQNQRIIELLESQY